MLKKFFLPPLIACKKQLVLLFFSLLIITLMQALFLLLTGPVLTLLFSAPHTTLSLAQLSPLAAQLLPEVSLPRTFFLFWLPLLLASTGLIKSACAYLFRYCQNYISLWMAKHLRQELCTAIIAQPYTSFLRKPAAHWMSIIMNDTFLLQARFSDIMTCFIRNTAQVCTCVVVLALLHYPSALALIVIACLLTFVLRNLSRRIVAFAEEYQAKLATLSTQVLDLRKRFEFIRSQGGTALEMQKFTDSSYAYYRAVRRSILVRTGLSPLSEFIGVVIFAVVVLLINQRLWLLDRAPVTIVQFLVALGMVLKPLRNFTDQLSSLQETRGALQSCCKILAVPQQKLAEIATPPPLQKDFVIERVVIPCDTDDELVFTSLPIKFGTITALIGSSGAGKSSLAKVLAGLITPLQWQCQHELAQLSQHVSYAGQKPFLFHDTLHNNLCYGASTRQKVSGASKRQKVSGASTRQKVSGASTRQKVSGASKRQRSERNEASDLEHDNTTQKKIAYYLKVLQLEKDLHSTFNPLTPELSGGQLQKLTIIRALLRPASILVLDEITAAIDMEMERTIIDELRTIARHEHRWVLVITHRQQLLHTFDQVWLAQRGQPLLQGRHEEQLAQHAAYRTFVQNSDRHARAESQDNSLQF